MAITSEVFARAGLLGNPSDGYFGKIIAVAVRNFSARVHLREAETLSIEPADQDLDEYRSAEDFIKKVNLYGYYGGARLITAGVGEFP
jgi:glucuronokinase